MAADYAARGLAYCREHDINSYEPYLMAWQARLQLDSGRWDDALASAAGVLANPRAIPPARMLALVVQGLVAARRGSDGASAELDAAFELARAADELQRLAPVAAARAEAAWLARDADGVLAATSEAFELALARPQPWWLGELAAWRRRAGAPVEVAAALAQPFALELAGDPVRAADAWADLGCPYDAALALAEAHEEQALRRALAELQRLGAQPAARIVARRLRERGARNIPSGPRRATAANPGELTPRELDVLALLAEGLRNAEIAERLVVSPRTVDHHISSILRKLGVRDRAQAVATARRLGVTNAP
jgi:DNA-binding CsgD family transcriptional regulator